jgi:mortality factor 4-like protein 1
MLSWTSSLQSKGQKDKQGEYFIHHTGWNRNWDEWVPESRALKYVDTNLQKQRTLKAN